MHRFILHIDFNSYFATAEQQCNPFLRGKPIAIGGSPGSRSVIVAASKEAKKFGVKTAMQTSLALRLCPNLMFIDGDPVKYQELTQKFINICKQYTDRVEVYSIDEVFLDLTGWVSSADEAVNKVLSLKDNLIHGVGDYLTCSVGIAPNRMMSKLASSMKKPNGIVIIPPDQLRDVLDWVELTDIPGIGDRLKVRLFDMGIRTLRQLGDYPVQELQRVFGPNNGVMLKEMGQGIDHSEIPYVDEAEEAKSIGHNYTLARNTKSRDEVYRVLLKLAEKVGRRLRRDHYEARRVWVHLRWEDMTGSGEAKTLKHFIDDGYDVYKVAVSLLDHWAFRQPVRLVGVGTTMLRKEGKQGSILPDKDRKERLLAAQDQISDKYGEFTIRRASILRTSLKRKVGGFKEPHQFKLE